MEKEYIGEAGGKPHNAGRTGGVGDGHGARVGKGKAIRLTHHAERIAFPRDGKKAKAYFQNLRDKYTRCWCVNSIRDPWQSELVYYQEHYAAIAKARNKTYARARHAERMITTRDLHGRKRTCPEELSLQAGRGKGEGVPGYGVFAGCVMKYLSWMREWSNEHGGHMHVLSVHVSQEAPYRAVIRRVWECSGKDGLMQVSMTGALREAGVPCPDPEAEESRYNNRKMTFDRISRDALYECFESAGISVIREPGIYTLRQALKIKEGTDAQERDAEAMLRQILEIEEQASLLGVMEDAQEDLDGNVLVSEEAYRLLKIREGLGGAYAFKAAKAGRELLAALEEEQGAERDRAMQEGIWKERELEYAALRIGLLRCDYYASDGKGGSRDEGVPQ